MPDQKTDFPFKMEGTRQEYQAADSLAGQKAATPGQAESPAAALDRIAREAAPAPQRPARQPAPRKPYASYRNGLLLLTGLACFAIVAVVALFLWSIIVYSQTLDTENSTAVPLLIFLGAIFVSSALVTALSRGGSVFPPLMLCLVICLASFFLANVGDIRIGGLFLKLFCSLLTSIVAFTLVKMHWLRKQRSQAPRPPRRTV